MFNLFFYLAITVLYILIPQKAISQVFFDDFKGKELDTTLWSISDRKWCDLSTHGGVVPQNVWVKNGCLVIRALGEKYKGTVKGHGQNTRVGGVIFTKNKYASGSFEIRAKICPQPGALSAFWTYYNENDLCNHEIDFEFPGRNQKPHYKPENSDLRWGLVSSWRGVPDSMRRTSDIYFGNQTDGKFHLYRFEWHTGSATQRPKIEWYFDNKLVKQHNDHIPNYSSPFWLGIWFPTWISPANFKIDYMYVDWVKITPFHEPNDDLKSEKPFM